MFGGGVLFRALEDAALVDTIELAGMPVLLGDGIPLVPPGPVIKKLRLVESHARPSGIVMLTYEGGERS